MNTAEKFLLLIMHPEKPRYVIPETAINPGLFGAIFVDLSIEGKIEFEDKRIKAKSSYTKISKAHDEILRKIAASKKRKKIKRWIAGFAWKGRKYRHMILHDLARDGKIRLEDKRFIIFPYKSAYLIDRKYRESQLKELNDIILTGKSLDVETASILGIIEACKMHKVLTRNKESLKMIKSNLKEMVKHDSVSQEVKQVIAEMQAAAVAAGVVTTSP